MFAGIDGSTRLRPSEATTPTQRRPGVSRGSAVFAHPGPPLRDTRADVHALFNALIRDDAPSRTVR